MSWTYLFILVILFHYVLQLKYIFSRGFYFRNVFSIIFWREPNNWIKVPALEIYYGNHDYDFAIICWDERQWRFVWSGILYKYIIMCCNNNPMFHVSYILLFTWIFNLFLLWCFKIVVNQTISYSGSRKYYLISRQFFCNLCIFQNNFLYTL